MKTKMIHQDEELEGLTTGRSNLMCFPLLLNTVCCSSSDVTTASFTFNKVVLSSEEAHNYQLPWEQQQKHIKKNQRKSFCFCWCCLCSCLCKPVNNRKNRRVSNSRIEKRADSYKNLIEITKPSIDQIHKWSSDFDYLVEDQAGLLLFDLFLQQEHSDENLKFWIDVNHLKTIVDIKEKRLMMKKIYKEFLKPLSFREINVSGITRRKIEEELLNEPADTVFDNAQNEVFVMMHRQSYPRFLASDLFHAVVQRTYAYNKQVNAVNITTNIQSPPSNTTAKLQPPPVIEKTKDLQ